MMEAIRGSSGGSKHAGLRVRNRATPAFVLAASALLLLLPGCAVVTVAGAAAGAAIGVAGAVVSTGVTVAGKAVGAVMPGP